jgi:hypothetical protein
MSASVKTYRQHLACLSSISSWRCTTCDRQVGDDEVATRDADYGWRHIPCGRLVRERDGRPWCDSQDCNYFVNPVELALNDPLSA